jgi:MSHA biogenesis protein MshM
VAEAAILENQMSFDLSELRENPFSRTADTSYPYLSSSFREALAALYYGLEYGSRILMLSADRGLGKTTLLRHFQRRMQDRGPTLFLSPSHDNGSEVLCKLLDEIGGMAAGDDLLAMRAQVDQILVTVAEAEKPFILLLDYDQDAAQSALETLRLLTSLELFEKGLLRVVVAGSPGVAERLQDSEFADEIRRVPLAPLAAAEVETYIDYRLRLAGWRGGRLFTAKACALIAERCSANPLAINEICFNLLQNLIEEESSRSDRANRNNDYIIDEYRVDSVLSVREPIVLVSVYSSSRRTVALACVVLMLVLVLAGLWYRGIIKAWAAKHVTAEIGAPLAKLFHYPVIHDARPKRLTNPARAAAATRAAGKSVAGNSATKAASEPAHDGGTAWLSHVTSSVASAAPIATPGTAWLPHIISPVASAALSATPGITAAHNTVAVGVTSAVPPALASPTAEALHGTGDHRTEAVAKKDHELVSAPLSRIVQPRQTPTSSPMPQEKAVTHTAGARRVMIAARGANNTARTAQEMAASEIRLGDIYMNLGEYDKALRSFSRAIAFAPDNKEAQQKARRARRAKTAEENILR